MYEAKDLNTFKEQKDLVCLCHVYSHVYSHVYRLHPDINTTDLNIFMGNPPIFGVVTVQPNESPSHSNGRLGHPDIKPQCVRSLGKVHESRAC